MPSAPAPLQHTSTQAARRRSALGGVDAASAFAGWGNRASAPAGGRVGGQAQAKGSGSLGGRFFAVGGPAVEQPTVFGAAYAVLWHSREQAESWPLVDADQEYVPREWGGVGAGWGPCLD